MAGRNPFGLALGNALQQPVTGDLPPVFTQKIAVPSPSPQSPKMGKGQLIMGIIADALAGAAGRPGPFATMMNQQRQQETEEANWGKRLEREMEIRSRYEKPDIPPMVRDVQAYTGMTPEQRAAWQEMNDMKRGDPDVFITLPNGQVYAGPKSGLAAAMMGGAPTAPTAPVGRLTPITGGPTAPPSGGFRY